MDKEEKDINELINKANKVFLDNFTAETWFERAIFYSWYCKIRDCQYCYMSTQPADDNESDSNAKNKKAVRSKESLIAEAALCKKLGWKLGFFSGGIDAFSKGKFLEILKDVSESYGEKLWLNVGALKEEDIKEMLPYTKGVVGSIECINPKIHDKICPSKPIGPYEKMFEIATKYGLLKGMTIIIGLGEKKEDFERLKEFIKRYDISKIHFYGLNPQKGTIYEKSLPPTKEEQAWWIAKTRLEFPKIDIQCGIWLERVDYLEMLLKAGTNSISKFPMMKKFGSIECKEVVKQAKRAGRKFNGNIVDIESALDIDWKKEIEMLSLDKGLKDKVMEKIEIYLKGFKKNIK